MRIAAGISLLFIAASCAGEKSTPAPAQNATQSASSTVESIASPAGAGAAEPFLFATDGVLLSWLEPVEGTDRTALRFARFRDGKWTAPRTIVERNDLFVNWADFPSIVEDAQGTLFAHWLQKSGKGTYSYDVRMTSSRDGGITWREPFLLNRDGKEAEHGFVTLVVLPDGGVGATWLDGRRMAANGREEEGGDMGIRYATVSPDGTIANETELDARTCECCTTGTAMTSSGPVIVYRDRSGGEVRDIFRVAKTAGGWTAPAHVNDDGWTINACPVNGPQIDAIGRRVATAWFTGAQNHARVQVAFSDDGGNTFAPAVRIDDGKPVGRVDLVLLDESTALVAWLEQTSTGGELRARRVRDDGRLEPSMKIADSSTARAAGFVRIARVGREVYFAWTDAAEKSKRIRIARARF